jgi:hypothetical protein
VVVTPGGYTATAVTAGDGDLGSTDGIPVAGSPLGECLTCPLDRSRPLAQPPELLHGERDVLLEDHVLVNATITVFRERSDSRWADVYPDLPVGSDDLDDWAVAVLYQRDLDNWLEGCEPDLVCAEGEEPTVSTDAWQTTFNGFVGNLEFYVTVTYVAERLPTNAQALNVAVFRELVLAEVDRRAKRRRTSRYAGSLHRNDGDGVLDSPEVVRVAGEQRQSAGGRGCGRQLFEPDCAGPPVSGQSDTLVEFGERDRLESGYLGQAVSAQYVEIEIDAGVQDTSQTSGRGYTRMPYASKGLVNHLRYDTLIASWSDSGPTWRTSLHGTGYQLAKINTGGTLTQQQAYCGPAPV